MDISIADSLLYIEDDQDIIDSVTKILEAKTNKLYFAKDGLEGLELFHKYTPDIIITDLNLPKLNGFSLIRQIKKINPNQAIIILTGNSEKETLLKAIKLQVNNFFLKPVDLFQIVSSISKIARSINLQKELDEKESLYKEEVDKNISLSYNLQRNQEELINQSKFAAMGEMLSMIAHQWRQPLNNIMLNVTTINQMVENKKIVKSQFDTTIKNMTDTINHMNNTIDDFRDFLRHNDEKRKVRIVDLVIKPRLLIGAELKKYNIKFKFEPHINIRDTIEVESSKFIQVMMNLYKNSIDEFITKPHIKKPLIKVSVDKYEQQYFFTITDNAGGVPENIIKRVFDPYFSTKSKNGTGLGLYMCKRIMNEYFDGDISVTNNKEGAEFLINFKDPHFNEDEDSFAQLSSSCYKWDKEKVCFFRQKTCTDKELLQQSSQIFKTLDSFFIEYELDEHLNIKIVLT